jgi:hypothetical protein
MVTYSTRTNPVNANLDGAADDGESGEGDRIKTDVENITGGSGSDTIVGGPGDNSLSGGGGNDTIDGSTGVDGLSGGPGADSIVSRDSVGDAVLCGTEIDSVIADWLDAITADCESVDRGPAGSGSGSGGGNGGSGGGNGSGGNGSGGNGGGGSGDGTGVPALVILDRGLTADKKGNLKILLICVGPSRCNGTSSVVTASKMRLRPSTARRKFSLGGRSFSFPAGTSATLRVRMTTNLYKLLVRRKTFLLRITAKITDSSGQRISSRRLRVRASKAALRDAARQKGCGAQKTASTAPARCTKCPAAQAPAQRGAQPKSTAQGRASLRGTSRPSAKSTLPSTCRQDRSRPTSGSQ